MKKNIYLFVILLAMILSSCSSVYTWSDQREGVDFYSYQTYMIDEQCSDYNPGINPINQQRIKNAIELELRDLGYMRAENADINVKFLVKNETKFFYENCLRDYSGYRGGEMCIEKVHTYEEGSLVIDLIDIRSNTAIWHGGASGKSWKKIENPQSAISKMVSSIFNQYRATASIKESEVIAQTTPK